jgi:hypothetical protein
MCDMFLFLLVCSCRLTPLGIRYHHMLHTNTTHCVWYVSFSTGIVMRLSPFGIWYHHLLHTNMTHCVWYVSFTTGIFMSSLPVRYWVSPSVAHEHDTLCMIGFVYYWYCHVVSLLLVFGITICFTRTWHIVYDRFLLLLVLSCRLHPLGIWYHHLLHTNTTHCAW